MQRMNAPFDPAALKSLREKRMLTKKGVALLAYCEDSAYEAWENGEEAPSSFWQGRLAKALRCQIEDFCVREK